MYNKIITGLLISVFTVGIASAMDMDTSGSAMIKDDMKTGTMAKDTMMKDSMSGMVATSSDMMMYDKVTATSKKTDVAKLQMMLVEKGYLMMPKHAAYGHYGSLTKAAYKKYKSGTMMKTDMTHSDTMTH